jgi:hypothetical protein
MGQPRQFDRKYCLAIRRVLVPTSAAIVLQSGLGPVPTCLRKT